MSRGQERAVQQHDELMEGSVRQLRRRAREEMAEFVAGLREWDLFATFTYDQATFDAVPSLRFAERDVGRYVEEAEVWLKRPVTALCAVETHLSGFPHAHGLLDIGGLTTWEISALSDCWRSLPWRGFIRLERPRSPGDVAGYCAKYFVGASGKPEAPLVASKGLLQGVLPVRHEVLTGGGSVRPRLSPAGRRRVPRRRR